MKNRVFLKDFAVLQSKPYTEVFYADGSTRFFSLANQGSVYKDDIKVRLVTGDGSGSGFDQMLLWDFVDGQPGDGLAATGVAFYCFENRGVRFPDGNPPPSGDKVVIDYPYYVPENIYRVDDLDSQSAMARRLGESGVFEFLQSSSNIRAQDYNSIDIQGKITLGIYAPVNKSCSITTHVKGWKVSQLAQVRSATNNFSQELYVTSITKRPVTSQADSNRGAVTEYNVGFRSRADVYF